MKRIAATVLIALTGLASLVLNACGGGGSADEAEQPNVPTPGVACASKPEQCK